MLFTYTSVCLIVLEGVRVYALNVFDVTLFSVMAGLFGILVYFGVLLERQLHAVRRYAKHTGTVFELIGLRLSTNLTILWINPEHCEKMLGYTSGQLIGKPFDVLVDPQSEEAVRSLRDYVKNTRYTNPISVRLQLVHKNHSKPWFLMAVQKVLSDGQLETLRAGLQNITAEVYQQEFLGLLKQTFDAANIGITIVDDDTKTILYVNHFEAEIHGYTSHELIGKDARMLAPDMMQGMIDTDDDTMKTYTSLNLHKNGQIFPVKLNKTLVTYGTGASQRHARVMFCQRLTELTPYEAVILGDRALLLMVIRQTGDIYWLNEVFQQVLGVLSATTLPETVFTVFDQRSAADIVQACADKREEVPRRYVAFDHEGLPHYMILSLFFGGSYAFLIGQEVMSGGDFT